MPCPICDSNDHDSQRTDREAVLAAVGKDGRALWHAPDELKADKEVFEAAKASMIKAVGQDGLALEYAPDELKADKEVVLAAVGQDGRALPTGRWSWRPWARAGANSTYTRCGLPRTS